MGNSVKISKPIDQCPKCGSYMNVGNSGSKYCLEPNCNEFIIIQKPKT